MGYIAKDGRSLDDSLTKGPAPGTVLNKDQYVVIEVTRYSRPSPTSTWFLAGRLTVLSSTGYS